MPLPVKAIDHLQLPPQILLSEVIQHPGVHQALHERCSVLRKTQRRQPGVADPLVVHVTERQGGPRRFGRGWRGERHHLLNGQSQLQTVQRVADSYLPLDLRVAQSTHYGTGFDVGSAGGNVPRGHAHPQFQPGHDRGTVPEGKRGTRFHGFREQLVSVITLPFRKNFSVK